VVNRHSRDGMSESKPKAHPTETPSANQDNYIQFKGFPSCRPGSAIHDGGLTSAKNACFAAVDDQN
jgi:hypothetical protein